MLVGMMELADVADSKSAGSDTVRVQVPLPAPSVKSQPCISRLAFLFSKREIKASMQQSTIPESCRFEQLSKTLLLAVTKEHTFGSDAFLLADFAGKGLRHKDLAVDLGTGCGIIAFLLYKNMRPKEMWGVDIQKLAIEQFKLSLEQSAAMGEPLDGILKPICSDLKDLKGKLPFGTFDLVTCNPPYKTCGTGILSSLPSHQIARHEVMCSLDDVCHTASSLLKTGGRFCLCLRPERLCDILCSMRANRLEPKRAQFVARDDHTQPWLVLVEGKKDAKPYMDILPTLIFDTKTAAKITHYGDYEKEEA